MKKASNFKIVLYKEEEKNNKIVKGFLEMIEPEFLVYKDEDDLGLHIEKLKNKGFNSKEVLILKDFKGRIFQKCPGSPNMICCNYLLLNTCFDCLYNCSYCFLNFYKNSFGIVQFTNIDKLFLEIDEKIGVKKDLIYRIGTGEFTDSLMMDERTGIAKEIIERSAKYDNIMIEFKTKSNNVDHILDIENKGNTVIAWSLNTIRNIRESEFDTATLDERLSAAKKAQDAGYLLAFHFDPIIIYDGHETDYLDVIEKIAEFVNPDGIAWISLGCFRYASSFKDVMSEKFTNETLTLEEMFPGLDGKYRYIKNKRINIFSKMLNKIRSYTEKPFVYLCMEATDVWESVFDITYNNSEELEIDFSNHLKKHFIKK